MITSNKHLSYLAFTFMLEDAKSKNENPVAWACMSETAKEEWLEKARINLRNTLLSKGDFLAAAMTDQGFDMVLSSVPAVVQATKQWEEHESQLEKQRNAGNPTAFFIHT